MGWLWMCLGVRDKSARRIGGRVSSDTYLAPEYDPTKTPRIEDYLQPRSDGPSPSKPDGRGQEAHAYRRCVSERTHWRDADGVAVEDFVAVEFPRARKSFSELLIETHTLENGPLALAAVAAASERAASSLRAHDFGAPTKIVTLARDSAGEGLEREPPVVHESPLSPSLVDAPGVAALAKDHLEGSTAVAAFKESRRQSQLAEWPAHVATALRPSRKRALPVRSRSLQRPLSPVPEALSHDEELRTRRKSDAALPSSRPGDLDTAAPSGDPSPSNQLEGSHLSGADSTSWDDYVLVESALDTTPTSDQPASADDDADPGPSTIDVQTLDPDSDSSSQGDAMVVPQGDVAASTDSEVQHEEDAMVVPQGDVVADGEEEDGLMRTPARDPLVTPEVFISPKTTSAELTFTRVMDIDPEERPIFGSLADHWEAAWATKRPAWDGKGIPNSTHKYREEEKVMWHATPFEERLAQALATQQDSVPKRRNSFNGRTSRLAASRSGTSLQAH